MNAESKSFIWKLKSHRENLKFEGLPKFFGTSAQLNVLAEVMGKVLVTFIEHIKVKCELPKIFFSKNLKIVTGMFGVSDV